jgi:8-oxo-dGTP diphosphatase
MVVQFKNTPNQCVTIDGKEQWISRSVTVLPVILLVKGQGIYVPLNKRGVALPDEVGKWGLPGGYLDYDETAGEAVIRECWEEMGLNLLDLADRHRLVGSLEQPTYVFSQPSRKQNVTLRFTMIFFLADGADLPILDPQVGSDEVEAAQWFTLAEALSMQLAFRHHEVIQVCLDTVFQGELVGVGE